LAAVAISPDQSTVVTGGQNRVLYILDQATLEVQKRHWFASRIGTLAYSQDGATLVVEDEKEQLYFLDAQTLASKHTIKETGYISTCINNNLLAGVAGKYNNREIHVLSLSDGSELAKIPLPEKTQVAALSVSPDCQQVVVLSKSRKSDSEEKRKPKDLKGLAKSEFMQKHDGNIATLFRYNIETGEQLSILDLNYTSSLGSTSILVAGSDIVIFNYNNVNVIINSAGEEKYFAAGNLGYGRGIAPDHQAFLIGGMREASYVRLGKPKLTVLKLDSFSSLTNSIGEAMRNAAKATISEDDISQFKIDTLPGWPEYFAAFSFLADGSAYGVTSAFRIVHINPDGSVEKVLPVF